MTILEVPINQYTGMTVDHEPHGWFDSMFADVAVAIFISKKVHNGYQGVFLKACCMEFIILANPGIWELMLFHVKIMFGTFTFSTRNPSMTPWPYLSVQIYHLPDNIKMGPVTHIRFRGCIHYTTDILTNDIRNVKKHVCMPRDWWQLAIHFVWGNLMDLFQTVQGLSWLGCLSLMFSCLGLGWVSIGSTQVQQTTK